MQRPNPHAGMRHLALFVENFDETLRFYTELLGMAVEWQPDEDNYYLCSGCDNLALASHAAWPDSVLTTWASSCASRKTWMPGIRSLWKTGWQSKRRRALTGTAPAAFTAWIRTAISCR